MGPKRYTPATFVFIALLLGVLVMVGRIVNPITAAEDPDKPKIGSETAPGAAEHAHDHAHEMAPEPGKETPHTGTGEAASKPAHADEKAKKEQPKAAAASAKKSFDPNSIDVTSDYFKSNKMGKVGIEEMDRKVAEARAKAKVPDPNKPRLVPMQTITDTPQPALK